MKKKVSTIVLLLVIFSLLLLMAPSMPYNAAIGWESSGSRHDVNNVEIIIRFGQGRSRWSDFEYNEQDEISVFLYRSNSPMWSDDTRPLNELKESPNFYLIRTLTANEFYTEDYFIAWGHPWSCTCSGRRHTFNHSEKIIIPQRLFSQNSGVIMLRIRVDRIRLNEDGESVRYFPVEESDSVAIYYRMDGQRVRISNSAL